MTIYYSLYPRQREDCRHPVSIFLRNSNRICQIQIRIHLCDSMHKYQNNQRLKHMRDRDNAELFSFYFWKRPGITKPVYHEHFPFGFIICTKTGNSYQEHALKKEGTLIMGEYETYGNQRFQTLFAELTDYEKRGVYILINGLPASPMQIVQAHSMREEGVYMRVGKQTG